ncbi:39S ribosomal protein L40, mitochondrial-like [Daphnia pulex]|uniref:39S ribosomal protein L40, mitochondrial-like n=1 Tax=Daphnia pulex TaxID=6669 RepID=UPI001EDCB40D|nr:39S ribosomal protein L40, mitochondrial-like [Daphnia pulex]XP_046648648.1 39S ribosomal protein L40, mitochondrial-like [Daphnia pulicaria]
MNKILRIRESLVLSSRMICTNIYFPTFLQVSTPLLAEPMKKKKKMDPQILKAREERKKKRIEKSIKKLEKNVKQLKPIEEIDLSISLQKEKWTRERAETVPEPLLRQRQNILKAWCTYKYQQHLQEMKMVDRIGTSQSRALEQLREISENLYIGAIQTDSTLLPFTAVGPSSTPPLNNYEVDGEYIDETPKWK